jgi:hypothetical protein
MSDVRELKSHIGWLEEHLKKHDSLDDIVALVDTLSEEMRGMRLALDRNTEKLDGLVDIFNRVFVTSRKPKR